MISQNGHKRAVLYARVSGDDTKKGNLNGQLDMCREYAQRQSWRIVTELAEDERGISGARWDAPELNRALDMAQAGEFDVLVTRELDRFARSLAKQLVFDEAFKKAGVDVVFVLQKFPDTPEGRLNKHIQGTIAEYEREQITKRLIRGRRRAVRAGNILTHGRAAYGYLFIKVDGKGQLEIDPETARIVRLIFDFYAQGASIREIVERLKGIPTPSEANDYPGIEKKRNYGEWSSSTVNRILNNETYAGKFTYGSGIVNIQPVTVQVPAIITPEIWAAVKERREKNRQTVNKRKRRYQYLLAGRVRCGCCGLAMHSMPVTKPGRKTRLYYRCPSGNTAKYVRQCDLPYFRANDVDDLAWQQIKTYITQPKKLEKGLNTYWLFGISREATTYRGVLIR